MASCELALVAAGGGDATVGEAAVSPGEGGSGGRSAGFVERGRTARFPDALEATATAGATFSVLTSASSLGISSSRTSLSARLPSSPGLARSWVLTSDNCKRRIRTGQGCWQGETYLRFELGESALCFCETRHFVRPELPKRVIWDGVTQIWAPTISEEIRLAVVSSCKNGSVEVGWRRLLTVVAEFVWQAMPSSRAEPFGGEILEHASKRSSQEGFVYFICKKLWPMQCLSVVLYRASF
jgi:hypothetical protein